MINIDLLRRAVIDAEWVRDYSESIVEAVQIPLLVLSDQMKVISANRAFYEHYLTSKNQTAGKNLYEVLAVQCKFENLKKPLEEMFLKKTSFQNVEMDCGQSETGKIVVSFSARALQSHEGNAMILLAIEDVTERKNREKEKKELLRQTEIAKAEAERANLTKDLFLATLSHELRTPLTSMRLQAQFLQRGALDEAKTRKAITAIEKAAKVQSQLIEDLLDVSRIVTGKLQMEKVSIDLNEVIRSAIDTVSALAESKSIKIEANLMDAGGKIMGDPVRLQQVIWNLLTNAIKFTTSGKHDKIIVNLKMVENSAQIQVIDKGIGIDLDFLPYVFNRFSQAEASSTRTHSGLGLGLAIVRHLVELHGGVVKVESAGKGLGATFTVILPK